MGRGGGGVSSLSGDKYLGKVGKPRPGDKISHLKEEGARQEKNKVRQQVNHLTDGHMTRVQRRDAENGGRVQLAALQCQITLPSASLKSYKLFYYFTVAISHKLHTLLLKYIFNFSLFFFLFSYIFLNIF